MKISVIICTHNPDQPRLNRVFEALARQSLPMEEWECLLVDNASSPERISGIDMSWHPAGRMVGECRLGLTYARLKGIAETSGEILVFVDDDCLLAPDYLQVVGRTLGENPFLGTLGGYGTAEYEQPPPDWINSTFRWYHLDFSVERSEHPLVYARCHRIGEWTPVGAGMAVRRDVAEGYVQSIRADVKALALDRTGTLLSGGGDLDLSIHAVQQGYATGRSDHLAFRHVVPAFRLELAYMLRLLYMSQYSVAQLLIHRGWRAPLPLMVPTVWERLKSKLAGWKRMDPEALGWQAYHRGFLDGLQSRAPDSRFVGG